MAVVPDAASPFIALVSIRTRDEKTQHALVDMLAEDVEAWVRHCPGFISANYHLSTDGTSLVNYALWTSEQAYRDSFDHNPDKAAMRQAIKETPGVLDGPSMTGYRLERSISAPKPAEATDDLWETADRVRRGAMQLGSRLRKENPENPPAVHELTVLVQLMNHRAPKAVQDLADYDQVPADAMRRTLAGLAGRGLVTHRLVHLAADHGVAQRAVDRFYRAFWAEGRDLAHHGTLVELAAEAGVPAAEARGVLDSDRYEAAVHADREEALTRGVHGVPTVVVAGKYSLPATADPADLARSLDQVAQKEAAVG